MDGRMLETSGWMGRGCGAQSSVLRRHVHEGHQEISVLPGLSLLLGPFHPATDSL